MSRKRILSVFLNTLKMHKSALVIYFLTIILCGCVFALYALPLEPFVYAFLLTACIGLVLFLISFCMEVSHSEKRERCVKAALTDWTSLPAAKTLAEADYQAMIQQLGEELARVKADFESARQADLDYYTAWVHQVKTPIAVIRLAIGSSDTAEHRTLETELFRIEQYVDMVLQYIRLDSSTNDLVIKEHRLDDLIRESVRKFARQFVYRKLSLDYQETELRIVTDQKWFSCILEQLLSNAVKYTPSGTITIRATEQYLMISDTGIGIAADELPRIFEKGYTGSNGRLEKQSSGLGLYLCKRAADLLAIPIRAESRVGTGSTFVLDLKNAIAGLK